MKRKVIVGVVIVGMAVSGLYFWQNSPVEPESQKVSQDNGVDTETTLNGEEKSSDRVADTVIKNAEGSDSVVDKVIKKVEELMGRAPADKNQATEELGQAGTVESPGEQGQTQTPEDLEAVIVAKYKGKFAALKTEYQQKIDALLAEAKAEYLAVPEKDRGKAKITLGFKYLRKGKALESQCDDEFEAILDQMKKELKANNFTTDEVKLADQKYEAEKKARSKYLMDKAMGKD